MKGIRKISALILSAALIAACGKSSPEEEQNRIAFDTVVGVRSTKAGSSAYAGADFGTYAWKTTGTWESTADAAKLSSPYIINAETTDGGDGKWYPGSFRWPSTSAYLHFACYAPYKSSSPMTYSLANGISIDGYTIDYSAAAEDLLYSDLSKNNSDTKVACPILFHHALCQIVVKLKTDGIPSGLTTVVSSTSVTLKSLSFSGVKNIGDFRQNSSPKWSGLSGSASHTVFSGSKNLTTTPDESCAVFYVIPQAFETNLQAINLTYDTGITYSNSTSKAKNGINETHYFSDLSLTNAWEAGKQVVYTITVSAFGDEISFSASTGDWSEQSISGNLGGPTNF